MRYSLR
jgi:hypothetical protein